ncbi:N-acetylmuramoyl-L-alanine amidase [Tenacibaculum maritimum]|uniref:N-acetylmuramoyl-L-alanine amidase n=2 Tax=Tenacibaculum maritimum TaxID=107401 RepID=UPI001E4E347A|nr:N-acetylmuramoyl-L-alanine amidase [Tenacibaculum maritimum]MCD9583758.1 N-acetylmuramoyl-L-alanine amidase [Tenacibaculum maritimum]MCD9619486.1 N-acetylmuramoyl-L-alanine amidase [Tenacibaculum maritimum]MCD9626172.1 N-acetylmuramoyl-L-alanine amidase [Tenacibaculum maritimum]MCD9629164.1 N-acetylmuramoyl-L-alanine amidase [Tenacibaculum maritimum]MCD9631615.1 N-acetylmuramoyl-L-alanine amidase [Tenacibaculum maritimum]
MIPIIDTGHGYNTPGKRSKGFYDEEGRVLLKENSVNEAVGNKLSLLFYLNHKEAHFISNEWYDISLEERIRREKELANDNTFFISIHADAFHVKNKAKGGRFFYYSNKGREIALHLTNYLKGNGYGLSLREPMKANFKVLRATQSPAVLFEMGFMTTKSDLEILLTDEFRNKTAALLYEAITSMR